MSVDTQPFAIPLVGSDPLSLSIEQGIALFILGANGVGKSSLMHYLYRKSKERGQPVRWIKAHRQTWFDTNELNITHKSRREIESNFSTYDLYQESRWMDAHSNAKITTALFDIIDKENAQSRAIRSDLKQG